MDHMGYQIEDRAMKVWRMPEDLDERRQSKKFKGDKNTQLPEGWLECPNFGREIHFIVPSKVTLDDTFNDCIPPNKRFSVCQVLKSFKIGMVVDLTNTDRYYSVTEIKNRGLKYLKIRCQGRDAVPDEEAVNNFVSEVARFISNQKKRVFVHCTHGHNRTGYMIVHYLLRTGHACSVTEAVQMFAKARPPGIYKQDYINSLYALHHETKPDSVSSPSTPVWKISSASDLNGQARVPYPPPISDKQEEDNVIMTNDDVLGDKIPAEQEFQLRRFCLDMLGLTKGRHCSSQFPGSHPVSLDRENLQLLRQSYYYVSRKADGTRYMLLLLSDGCFLVDRRFTFRRVQMRFPWKNSTKRHHFTLLDGEMVIEDISPGKQLRKYLIYDLIAINGVSIVERPFSERFKLIDELVIEPRNNAKRFYRYDLEPFMVGRKGFWFLSTVGKVLQLIPKLSHAADVLIFQGWDDCYVPRTHNGLLKWKYSQMNSVDFLLEVGKDGTQYLYLYKQGKKWLMDNARVTFKNVFDSPSSYSGKIIECSWDSEANVWVFMRVRADKSVPNGYYTYEKVMKSINDNITEEVLLKEIGEIVRLPMYVHRTQLDNAAAGKRN